MPLVLLGSEQAMQLCAGDLTGPVNDPPFTSLARELELRKYLLDVAAWASDSKVAKEILYVVQNCEPNIYVVGMKGGGFSCFNSDYPKYGTGTVYYNLGLKMEIGFHPGPTETASKFAMGPKRNVSLHNYVGSCTSSDTPSSLLRIPDSSGNPRIRKRTTSSGRTKVSHR